MNLPTIHPPKRRVGRGPRTPGPVPVAPTLVAASYVPEQSVTLTFARAVDAGGLVAAAVTVTDDVIGAVYQGTGAAVVVSPAVVRVNLQIVAMSSGSGVRLNATADTGIVAAGGGAAWAGAAELPLPFG